MADKYEILTGATDALAASIQACGASVSPLSPLADSVSVATADTSGCSISHGVTICEILTLVDADETQLACWINGLSGLLEGVPTSFEPEDTSFIPGEGLSGYEERMTLVSFYYLHEIDKILVTRNQRISVLTIQRLSVEKRKQYLEANMPVDKTIPAWCADFIEDLSGAVGTVEIPGETTHIQIQPGYESNATYNPTRDGQIKPTVITTAAQAFYNLAMMPGWQKWMPTFRYGTITGVDGDAASVALEGIKSSQQALEINQTPALSGVKIEYMNCNGAVFEIGDEVLIKFTGQSWTTPVIVGFKNNPKPCEFYIKIKCNGVTPTIPKTVRLWYTDADGVPTVQTRSSSEAEPDLCGPFTGIYFPATIGLGNGGVPDGAPHPDQASKRLFHFWQEVDPVVYTSAKYLVSRSEDSGKYIDGTMTQDLTNILYDAEPPLSLSGNTVIISEISYKKLSTQLSEIPTGVVNFDGLKILQRRATVNISLDLDASWCGCELLAGDISTIPDSTITPEDADQPVIYADDGRCYTTDHTVNAVDDLIGCGGGYSGGHCVGTGYYQGSALAAAGLVILTDENGDSPIHTETTFDYKFDGTIQAVDTDGETETCITEYDQITIKTWIIEMIDTPVDRF